MGSKACRSYKYQKGKRGESKEEEREEGREGEGESVNELRSRHLWPWCPCGIQSHYQGREHKRLSRFGGGVE